MAAFDTQLTIALQMTKDAVPESIEAEGASQSNIALLCVTVLLGQLSISFALLKLSQ